MDAAAHSSAEGKGCQATKDRQRTGNLRGPGGDGQAGTPQSEVEEDGKSGRVRCITQGCDVAEAEGCDADRWGESGEKVFRAAIPQEVAGLQAIADVEVDGAARGGWQDEAEEKTRCKGVIVATHIRWVIPATRSDDREFKNARGGAGVGKQGIVRCAANILGNNKRWQYIVIGK